MPDGDRDCGVGWVVALALVSWELPWEAVNTRPNDKVNTSTDKVLDLATTVLNATRGAPPCIARSMGTLVLAECTNFARTWNGPVVDDAAFRADLADLLGWLTDLHTYLLRGVHHHLRTGP